MFIIKISFDSPDSPKKKSEGVEDRRMQYEYENE